MVAAGAAYMLQAAGQGGRQGALAAPAASCHGTWWLVAALPPSSLTNYTHLHKHAEEISICTAMTKQLF